MTRTQAGLLLRVLVLSVVLLVATVYAQSTQEQGTAEATPAWKIVRAEIERLSPATIQPRLAAERMFILKLHLRNEGAPGNLPVKIFGRWVAQPPRPFALLGTYTHEIAFKQTASLELQLFPMLAPPARALGELYIMSGDQETARLLIEVPA
jgi:hypothetical protein